MFDDGEFEVTLIKSPKNALELQEIIAALLIEQIDTKHMYTFKTNHITFESLEEIPWTLDGEFGGQHDFVQIHNEKQALQIMVSPEHIFVSDGISGETEFGGGRRKDRRVEREKLLWKREKSFRRDLGLS